MSDRGQSPPWERGATFYGGETIDSANLGGSNLLGKTYVFEPATQFGYGTTQDQSGRFVTVKVVRNLSGVALKPGRLVVYATASTVAHEGAVSGYATAASDRPAGIVDEHLPAAGVPANDLFYLVVNGPSKFTTGATTAWAVATGDPLVPVAYGATAGDDLGGRAAKQDLTGATAVLGNQLQNVFGYAATTVAATTHLATQMPCVVHCRF